MPGCQSMINRFRSQRIRSDIIISQPNHQNQSFFRKHCLYFLCNCSDFIFVVLCRTFKGRHRNSHILSNRLADLLCRRFIDHLHPGDLNSVAFFFTAYNALRHLLPRKFYRFYCQIGSDRHTDFSSFLLF